MVIVQQSPGMAEALPQDLAELAAGLEDDTSQSGVEEQGAAGLRGLVRQIGTQAEMDYVDS